MPIYDFKCLKCEHQFEAIVRIGQTPDACPICQGNAHERMVSIPTVSTTKLRDRNIDQRNQQVDVKRKERKGDQIAFERDFHKKHT